MLDTKIYIDRTIKKIKCSATDIPTINYGNAILFLDKDNDYTKTFKVPKLYNGLISHKGNHFYFEHNITETPWSNHLSKPNSVHSYDVYQITPELTDKIIQTKIAHHWEVYFNSFNYFGKRFTTIRHGDFIEWYTYSSYRNKDGLVLPYNISPNDLERLEGISIGEYLEKHKKKYPKDGQELEHNISVWRNYKLELLLNTD